MKLLLAIVAAAALSGCAAYVPAYGGAQAYPGYGAGGYAYPYGAAQASPGPFYGGSSIVYGATIVAPRPAYSYPYRHRWGDRDGEGGRRHRRQPDGQREHAGPRDGSGWQR